MTTAALYALVLPEVKKAGRWLIRRLIEWGVQGTIQFIRCRISVLTDRRVRLMKRKAQRRTKGRKWRIEHLAERVSKRRRLLRWLLRVQGKLKSGLLQKVGRHYDAAFERIPWDHPLDRFETWAANRG